MEADLIRLEISRMSFDFDVTPEVVEFVVGFFEGDYWDNVDFPHKRHHNVMVDSDAKAIGRMCNVDRWDEIYLEYGALAHDFGRNLSTANLLKEGDHNVGSYIIAKLMARYIWGFTEDRAEILASGIMVHTADVFPGFISKWVRILRDSDRTSRIGLRGIIDIAWWLGYRDDYIENSSADQLLNDQILFDLHDPGSEAEAESYESKTRAYIDAYILPWLMEHGLLEEAERGVHMFTDRIYGVKSDKGDEWIIEPVLPEAQQLVMPRIISLNKFLRDNKLREVPVYKTPIQ